MAVEADWPDAYRVNRFVRGRGDDRTPRRRCAASSASRAGCGATRWCSTSWGGCASTTTVARRERAKAGFYGLDLYSLYRSIQAVIAYLDRVDPDAAARARERYACFDHFGEAATARPTASRPRSGPARRARRRSSSSCSSCSATRSSTSGGTGCSPRTSTSSPSRTRDRRGRRGVLPLDVPRPGLLLEPARPAHGRHPGRARRHLSRQRGEAARIVVWAHNSHLGDARPPRWPSRRAQLGQLMRERHPGECRLIGFTTYTGTVTAADDWDGPAGRKRVRPALPGFEALFHEAGEKEFLSRSGVGRGRRGAALAAAGAGDRRHLPPADRTAEPLLPGARGGPVRRGDPHRRDAGGRAAGADGRLGGGRGARDLPVQRVNTWPDRVLAL